MKKPGWSKRTVLRYALFQIPDTAALVMILIALGHLFDLPAWITWGVIAAWLAKDVLMFPFVWKAYDSTASKSVHAMIGSQGIAEEQLVPTGYVRVHGELWKAEVIDNGRIIEKGQPVRIRGNRGITLLVEHEEGGPNSLVFAHGPKQISERQEKPLDLS